MKKQNLYLFLTIVGTVLPNIFVAIESVTSGNIMFYKDVQLTFSGLFANWYSTAFVVDLFFLVILFLFWSFKEAKKYHMKNVYWVWIYTFALGLAGGLPLFLFLREKHLNRVEDK